MLMDEFSSSRVGAIVERRGGSESNGHQKVQSTIGFVGLGHMGSAMAANLAAAGHRVTEYVRRPDQMDKLFALGLKPTTEIADLFDREVVISMLPDDDAVHEVVFGRADLGIEGLASGLTPGAILLSMSTISTGAASRLASWLGGRYDFAPEYGQCVRRVDLGVARQRKTGLRTQDFVVLFGAIMAMKLDREPFRDVRVRRALGMAADWKQILETNAWSQGHGVPNPAIPAALREWSIPIDQLTPAGRRLYERDVTEARRLVAGAARSGGAAAPG